MKSVQLFIPCFIDQLYPETGFNTVKLLERAGYQVKYPSGQTCCGQPAFNAGFWDEAREVSTRFIKNFDDQTPIVSPSGSCTGMIKNYFATLAPNAVQNENWRDVTAHFFELSDFLVNQAHFFNFDAKWQGTAVYHDACGALRECGIKEEPRTLLRFVDGLELIPVPDSETCCGFGGTFSVKFEAISVAMAQQKVDNALAAGAKYILSTDASCLMHLQGYIDKNGLPIKTMHIADVLASGW